MANQIPLIVGTGSVKQIASADTLHADGINPRSGTILSLGTAVGTTAITLGVSGTTTTVPGNLTVTGTLTASTSGVFDGNVDLGDGGGGTINLGGAGTDIVVLKNNLTVGSNLVGIGSSTSDYLKELWVAEVTGSAGNAAINLRATGATVAGAYAIGTQGGFTNFTATDNSVAGALAGINTALAGGLDTLQTAYDAGATIAIDATGTVAITQTVAANAIIPFSVTSNATSTATAAATIATTAGGTGKGLRIANAGSNTGLEIATSGAGTGFFLDHTGTGAGAEILMGGSTTGHALASSTTALATGDALRINNSGSGNALRIRDATTDVFIIDQFGAITGTANNNGTAGSAISFTSGTTSTIGQGGGGLSLIGGEQSSTGAGKAGSSSLWAGAKSNAGGTGDAGDVSIRGGANAGSGAAGYASLEGGSATGTGAGGLIFVLGGDVTAGAGNGGVVTARGGHAFGTTGLGGAFAIAGGNSPGSVAGADVTATGGTSGTGKPGHMKISTSRGAAAVPATVTNAPVLTLEQTGASGALVTMFAGTDDPSTLTGVTANEGSLYLRDAGTSGFLYIKTGAGATAWTAVATGTGSGTLQNSYDNGNTIVVDASGPVAISQNAADPTVVPLTVATPATSTAAAAMTIQTVAGSTGTKGLLLANGGNDTGLKVSNTSTTGAGVEITASAATTNHLLSLTASSGSTGVGVRIDQSGVSATSVGVAVLIGQSAAASAQGIVVDYGTTASTGDAYKANQSGGGAGFLANMTGTSAGTGVSVSMGATTTGFGIVSNTTAGSTADAVRIHNSGSGDALHVKDGATDVLVINGSGAVAYTPTSGQTFGVTAAGAGAISLFTGIGGVTVSTAAGAGAGSGILINAAATAGGSAGGIEMSATATGTGLSGNIEIYTDSATGTSGDVRIGAKFASITGGVVIYTDSAPVAVAQQINITANGISGTLVEDAVTSISIGPTLATSIGIGHSGITTTVTGGLTQLTGAVSLTGNAASSLTTTSGTLSLAGNGTTTVNSVTGAVNLQYAGNTVVSVTSAGAVTMMPASGQNASITTAGAGNIVLVAATDLTFTAQGGTAIPFNANGADSNLVGFTATTIVGALNELKVGATATTASFTTFTGTPALGDVVKITANNTITQADANDGESATVGILLTTVTPFKVVVSGEVTGLSGLTAGTRYFVSETPGPVTGTAPTTSGALVRRMGWAKNTTTLCVDIGDGYLAS